MEIRENKGYNSIFHAKYFKHPVIKPIFEPDATSLDYKLANWSEWRSALEIRPYRLREERYLIRNCATENEQSNRRTRSRQSQFSSAVKRASVTRSNLQHFQRRSRLTAKECEHIWVGGSRATSASSSSSSAGERGIPFHKGLRKARF